MASSREERTRRLVRRVLLLFFVLFLIQGGRYLKGRFSTDLRVFRIVREIENLEAPDPSAPLRLGATRSRLAMRYLEGLAAVRTEGSCDPSTSPEMRVSALRALYRYFPESRTTRAMRAFEAIRNRSYFLNGKEARNFRPREERCAAGGEVHSRRSERNRCPACAARKVEAWRAFLHEHGQFPGADDARYRFARALEAAGRPIEALLTYGRLGDSGDGELPNLPWLTPGRVENILDISCDSVDLRVILTLPDCEPFWGECRYALGVALLREERPAEAVAWLQAGYADLLKEGKIGPVNGRNGRRAARRIRDQIRTAVRWARLLEALPDRPLEAGYAIGRLLYEKDHLFRNLYYHVFKRIRTDPYGTWEWPDARSRRYHREKNALEHARRWCRAMAMRYPGRSLGKRMAFTELLTWYRRLVPRPGRGHGPGYGNRTRKEIIREGVASADRFLLLYGDTNYADDALKLKADLVRLEDPRRAKRIYRELLTRYPDGDMTRHARAYLRRH